MSVLLRTIYQGSKVGQAASYSALHKDRTLSKIVKRQFAEKSAEQHSYPVGPPNAEPLKNGDPGYAQFLQNMEFFRRHGRYTYLSLQQLRERNPTSLSLISLQQK